MADTPKLIMPELTASQSQKEVTHNTALRFLDGLVQCTAIDKDLTEPPGGESDGDTYLIVTPGSSASDWNDKGDQIAYYQSSAYIYFVPEVGWRIYVQDEDTVYEYHGSAGWEPVASSGGANAYDIGACKNGSPASSEVLLRLPMVRDVNFADDLAGSQAKAGTAADAEAEFSIKIDGVEFGTMTFAISGTTATFATASGDQTFAAGEVLTVVAPGSQDAALAGVSFLLKGTKV